MRIAIVNLLQRDTTEQMGVDLSPVWEGFQKAFNRIASARSNVEVKLVFPEKSEFAVHFPYIEFLNNRWFVEAAVKAEEDGYDAVIPGAATDTGLHLLREVLKVPVVGISESSFLVASLLGDRFAGITVFERLIPPKERNLKFLGMDTRAIQRKPIRSCNLDLNDIAHLFDKKHLQSVIIPKFEQVAKECVKDGADVIIALDAWLGPAFSYYKYAKVPGTEIPVLDPAAAAIGMAEVTVDLQTNLGVSVSRALAYQSADRETLSRARQIYRDIS